MRVSLIVLAATFSIGCSESATEPSRLPATASLWGMVIEPSGACIEGASVEVLDGPALGRRIVQRTPCDRWSEDQDSRLPLLASPTILTGEDVGFRLERVCDVDRARRLKPSLQPKP